MDSSNQPATAQASEDFVRNFLEATPNPTLAFLGGSNAILFNAAAAKSFGISYSTQKVDANDLDLPISEAEEHFPLAKSQLPWVRVWRGELLENVFLKIQQPHCDPQMVLCAGKLIRQGDNDAPFAALITLTDVTAQYDKQMQQESSHQHLQMLLAGTNTGTWEWNIQTGEMQFSAQWSKLLGYSEAELKAFNFDSWRELHHPDDLPKISQIIRAHLEGEKPLFSTISRIKHKDGHWVWLQVHGRVYKRDGMNQPLLLAGIHLDASEVHEFEQQAIVSESYMAAVVNSSANVAIIATNTDGLITIFNPGAQALLGYTEEEMVGKQTPALIHLESEVVARSKELSEEKGQEIVGFDVFVHDAQQGITETRKWTYVNKLGEHLKVSLTVSPLLDGNSNVIGFLGIAIDETAQSEAEEKAQLAVQRFAGAFESTAVGMALVSLEGRWMVVNDALCQMLGYTRDELLASDFQTITHPDDLENDLALLTKLLAGEIQNYSMQKRYFRKDGQLIQALLWVAIVRDKNGSPIHFVSQIQNITEEYLARQQLESSETRLRGLFDLSPIGIILLDYKTGRAIEANRAVIAPTGYSDEEFYQLSDREITPREYGPVMSQAIEQLRNTGRYEAFEKEHIRKDGSRYPVLVQGILMKEPSGRQVVWSLVEDISERKRLDRIKNEFVSTVSHELRTPLTSISGALSLIVGGVLGEVPDEILEMLKIAAKSSERLSKLVNDLLDMDKLLAGKMDIKLELLDLQPVIDEAISTMQAFGESHGVSIVCTGNEQRTIRTDKGRLLQILSNLLSNACKHSQPGSQVTLHCESGPEDSVIFNVIDKGRGIPNEFRSRIFQKFAQADATDTSDTQGTGLGLAICKELTERLGGVIGYESEEGQGSHFWIRLPRARTEFNFDERTPRVLHVEDDADFARLVALQVSSWVDMDLAIDLSSAFEKIRLNHYDLILLDLFLPDGHGETLWETIHLAQPDVPIVILSGHEVPRKLADNVAAVLHKDESTLSRVVSTLHRIFEMGEAEK